MAISGGGGNQFGGDKLVSCEDGEENVTCSGGGEGNGKPSSSKGSFLDERMTSNASSSSPKM